MGPGPGHPDALAINHEIPHNGKLRQGLQNNGLLQIIDQRRACLTGRPVDYHSTGATYFFHAVAFPDNRSYLLAPCIDRILSYCHKDGDHIMGILVNKEPKDDTSGLSARYYLENEKGMFFVSEVKCLLNER